MGFSLPHEQIPIIKTTNCILVPSEIEIASPFSSTSSKEVECIRCGQCADVCPAQLLPQELQWSAKAKDQAQLSKLNLFDCIECGACAYVCPSQIPLVHYYRVAKAEIRQQKLLDIKAEKAKVRFEARKQRLEREKVARAEKHKKAAEARKARMNTDTSAAKSEKSAVADALARVKAKKAQAGIKQITAESYSEDTTTRSVAEDSNTSAVDTTTQSIAHADGSKSQVADAIARAKAKKLAQKNQAQIDSLDTLQNNESPSSMTSSQAAPVVIDRKAKVAVAIAKAKEKKRQAADNPSGQVDIVDTATKANLDTKTSFNNLEKSITALESNIDLEAAQTRKTQSEPQTVNNNDTNNLARKTKIAAAVAKAKAKKLAALSDKSTTSE
jgi:electron transport complex protein RnfC